MKKVLAAAIVSIAPFAIQPVSAQEYPGSWWLNPRTNRVEPIGDNSAIRNMPDSYFQAQTQPTSSSNWEAIATLQGGDTLYVSNRSRLKLHGPVGEGNVEFNARIIRLHHLPSQDTRYRANCTDPDLTDLGSDGTADVRVPLLPGTAAEAVYRWACPA